MKQTIRLAKAIWRSLDAPSGKGQSLVELALVMPFIIILLAGLMEIGYFASNYITMTEVTRTVARAATTLQNETSPLYWEDLSANMLIGSQLEPVDPDLQQRWLGKWRNCDPNDPNAKIGFYNFLGCVALQSINPLRPSGFEPGASLTDDIVISGFLVVPDREHVKVLTRYPSNANTCDPDDHRTSLGFTWGGNYVSSLGCLGSEFTDAEVGQLMDLNGFAKGIRPSNLQSYLQPQGMVLVEIHWQHETLSQFVGLAPIVSPVFDILGASTVISTWAAFPLPQVQ